MPEESNKSRRGRHGNHVRGSAHPHWNPGRITTSHGYAKVRVGPDHPFADSNGYAYEHLVIWVSAGNPPPGADEILHHKNGDKTDNRLSNLALLKRSEHAEHHNMARERDASGRFAAGDAA